MRAVLRSHPFVAGGLLVGALAVAGARRESRLAPAAWDPPEPPALEGPLTQNDELAGLETVVSCDQPEDVAFDDEGRLYTGNADGTVRRTVEPVDGDTGLALEPFAYTGGRPLALEFAGEELLVCVRGVGLVLVDPAGSARVLAARAGGRRIAFADDLHVTADGTVYFSDATVHDRYRDELLELQDTGRLLAYHPDSGETTVELSGLGFANGVAPGPDGESLLVTETSRYRVTRYWFDGDRAGDAERVLKNLPGFPDNIEAASDGSHWLAVPNRRDRVLDWLHEHPGLVRQLGKLPPAALNALDIDPYGLVLRVDADGTVLGSLHDPDGSVYGVTSATPHDGALYLGTLFGERVVRYPLE
jgi:sugar lactone lactonase YvrE